MMSLNDQRDPTTRLLNLFIIFSYKLNRIQQQTATATKKNTRPTNSNTHTLHPVLFRVYLYKDVYPFYICYNYMRMNLIFFFSSSLSRSFRFAFVRGFFQP